MRWNLAFIFKRITVQLLLTFLHFFTYGTIIETWLSPLKYGN